MINFFYKVKGSVSVFLVIILVPVIVVCSLFIDASRLKLAKSLTKSSADLTLNTGLSYYDLELSDYYGLLASSQSQTEFMENAEEFFTACMVSRGITPSDAAGWSASIMEALGKEDDIVDLLQIEVAGNFSVSPVEGANLADAAMIKAGIVDFMKYRAPIELLEDGAGIVSKFEKIGDMETVIPVETSLQNEKQEYYEAESELLKLCGDIYIDFNEYDAGEGITEEELAEIRQGMLTVREKYRELYKRMVKDLYNTGGRQKFLSVESRMNKNPDIGIYRETEADTLIALLVRCRNAVSGYENASAVLQAKLNATPYSKWQESYYDIQYWVHVSDAIADEYEAYIKALNEVLTAEARFRNAYASRRVVEEEDYYEFDEEGQLVWVHIPAEDVKDEYSGEAYATIEQSYDSVMDSIKKLKEGVPAQEIYGISARLQTISTDAIDNKRISSEAVDKELEELANDIYAFYQKLDHAGAKLAQIKQELESIEGVVAEYEQQYEEWKGEAEASAVLLEGADAQSDIVDTDLHEIGVIEGKEEPEGEAETHNLQQVKIEQKEVDACIQRIDNIEALLDAYKRIILEEYLYSEIPLMQLDSYSTFKAYSGIEESSIVIENAELEAYAGSAYEVVMKTPEADVYPDITPENSPDFTVNRPAFREWLDGQFTGKDLEDKTRADSVLDKLKKVIEEKEAEQEKEPETSENSANEIKGKSKLPSSEAGEGRMAGYGSRDGDGVESTTQLLGGRGFKGVLETGRDNLLALSYIFGMFTYDTYVKEGKYALAMEKKPDREITLNNYKEVYETQDTAWEAEDMKFTANKTVTNKMKNQANNYSFCNEIEYIIYGGTNANNRAASYGTIFGIRYAMNIAPVFSKYWNNRAVSQVALTISTSTSGIIPAPLIKLIICLGMTAAETAVDISCLKAGLPVLFIKTQKELYLQLDLEELAEGATELAGNIISEKSDREESEGLKLAYSDYLAVFLYIAMLVDEGGVYLRVADVIQCNMDCHDGEYKGDYLLSNAVTYYQLQADVRVKPLMLALPWSVQDGSNILDSSNWNTFHVSEIRGY